MPLANATLTSDYGEVRNLIIQDGRFYPRPVLPSSAPTSYVAGFTRATEGRRPFFLISRNFGLTMGPPHGILEV